MKQLKPMNHFLARCTSSRWRRSSDSPAQQRPRTPPPTLFSRRTARSSKRNTQTWFPALRAEVSNALPPLPEQEKAALQKAREAVKAAQRQADSAHESSSEAKNIEAKIANWRRFWIGGAEKKTAKAQADLQAAATDADRDAARKEIAKWQANKADGEKMINQATADLERAKANEPERGKSNDAAQAALAQARTEELNAAKALLADVEPFVSGDKMDAKLVKCGSWSRQHRAGLAAFAQTGARAKGAGRSTTLRREVDERNARCRRHSHGKYGRAMEIYSAIRQASPKAGEGVLHRLALATSLEHAVPIKQINAKDQAHEPATVDPVKHYLHYEKAYLNGELDPAFSHLSTWESPDGGRLRRPGRDSGVGARDAPKLPAGPHPESGLRLAVFRRRQDRSPVRFTRREGRPPVVEHLPEHHQRRRSVWPARVLRPVHSAQPSASRYGV